LFVTTDRHHHVCPIPIMHMAKDITQHENSLSIKYLWSLWYLACIQRWSFHFSKCYMDSYIW
jgi:hypothetical protein